MRSTTTWRLLALLLSGALVLSACSGGGDETDDTADDTASEAAEDSDAGETDAEPADDMTEDGDEPTEDDDMAAGEGSDAIVSTYIGQPESLTTTNNTESEGQAVLNALYTGLFNIDAETNELIEAAAESVETDDNITFTVTLKDGWTFHNGEPVTAQSYVDAWNYAAYGPNAQSTSAFFADIEGYDDVQCGLVETEDEETGETVEVSNCDEAPPAAETLAGLNVESDTVFTVTMSQEIPYFTTQLISPVFSPLPSAFFDDPAAFDRQPIGNGPFMMDGEWEDDVAINTVAYSDYQGEDAAQIGGIEFRIYADVTTAVTDLIAGNLDIVDNVPPEQWEDTIAEVPNHDLSASSSINYIGFPNYVAPFDNPDMRAALSMAIDREAITEGIFDGLRQPASNFLSPVIPAYQETIDGCDNWAYNPDLAAERFEAAGGIEALGDSIEIWFNEGGGHDLWMDAVITQWEQNLGIPASSVEFQQLPFAEYLELVDNQGLTGPFRLGWGASYLHPQYFTVLPLQKTADQGGNNATFWQSDDFDAAIEDALAFTSLEESIPAWEDVMAVACAETPVAPMFYGQNTFAWNDGVSGVNVNAFGDLVYEDLTAS